MLDRFFRLSENHTSVRTEMLAGLTTFLTMAYIIFVQPQILARTPAGEPTGMDSGAVTTATCLAAALATAIMGLYGRYPIAQAPGMGENVMFAGLIGTLMAAGSATPWQTALGVIFISGVLFLLLSLYGVREAILDAISPSMRNGIAIGIGLFIALIGLHNADVIRPNPHTLVELNRRLDSPDVLVFCFGLLLTVGLYARRVRGSIVLGIVASTLLAVALQWALPRLPEAISQSAAVTDSKLLNEFEPASGVISRPPSIAPTFLAMDLRAALTWPMLPFILIFLFMDLFDTLGTLVGVSEQAGLIKDNKLPRAKQALVSDAVGTAAGAALGTSTVQSFIESAAGVEQGGRTGLTALVVAVLFLLALFFYPIIAMVGSYQVITAPALVVVGGMMMRNVVKVDWRNHAESMPAFLIMIGIPMSYSIGDGLALGFISYPVIKLMAGQGREVRPMMALIAVVLVAYFVVVRTQAG
jgi:adenine/guanine/hypoxanthine permease